MATTRAANPPARIIEAVAAGEVDVAVVWGPLAGYFAKVQPVALRIEPVMPHVDLPMLPMIYEISMGVRRGDDTLRRRDQCRAREASTGD